MYSMPAPDGDYPSVYIPRINSLTYSILLFLWNTPRHKHIICISICDFFLEFKLVVAFSGSMNHNARAYSLLLFTILLEDGRDSGTHTKHSGFSGDNQRHETTNSAWRTRESSHTRCSAGHSGCFKFSVKQRGQCARDKKSIG